MSTLILVKILVPLGLLAAVAALYIQLESRPAQPHWNARQAAAIESLRTGNSQKDLK